MRDIPNKLEVDCCNTCKYGQIDYDITICKRYDEIMMHHEICDEFIRKND